MRYHPVKGVAGGVFRPAAAGRARRQMGAPPGEGDPAGPPAGQPYPLIGSTGMVGRMAPPGRIVPDAGR